MIRASLTFLLVAVLGSGCLDPRRPYLETADTTPPELQNQFPGSGEAIATDGVISLVFSEALDIPSLRPGISVNKVVGSVRGDDVEVEIFFDPVSAPTDEIKREDKQFEVGVRAAGGVWATGNYELRLSTLLSDLYGNPLPAARRTPFKVQ